VNYRAFNCALRGEAEGEKYSIEADLI